MNESQKHLHKVKKPDTKGYKCIIHLYDILENTKLQGHKWDQWFSWWMWGKEESLQKRMKKLFEMMEIFCISIVVITYYYTFVKLIKNCTPKKVYFNTGKLYVNKTNLEGKLLRDCNALI